MIVEARSGSQPNTLRERIDSKMRRSGHNVVDSVGHLGTNPRSFVHLETSLAPLAAKGLVDPIAYSLPYNPAHALIRLISAPEETIMRLAVFPQEATEPITVWKVVLKNRQDPQVSLTSGLHEKQNVEPTDEILAALGEIVDASEPVDRGLDYYKSRILAEIEPKVIKYTLGGREHEIQDPGLMWARQDVEEVMNAASMAWESHKGQRRKSGEPYFDHPFEGAMNLFRLGLATPVRIKMTLNHDVPEDDPRYQQPRIDPATGKAPESYVHWVRRIAHVFAKKMGFQAAKGSVLLAKPVPDGYTILTPEDAAREYDKNIKSSIDIIIVKVAADRWHNIKTLWAMPAENRKRTIQETREIYLPLLDRVPHHEVQMALVREDIEREMAALELLDK